MALGLVRIIDGMYIFKYAEGIKVNQGIFNIF